MKLNWGTSILLVIIGFMSFILFFVITMSTDKKYGHDLVVDDYYKKELSFQKEVNEEARAKTIAEQITFLKTDSVLEIRFPAHLHLNNTKGMVYLYRPSNKKLDFEKPLRFINNAVKIPNKLLIPGRWDITLSWSDKDLDYLIKKSIIY